MVFPHSAITDIINKDTLAQIPDPTQRAGGGDGDRRVELPRGERSPKILLFLQIKELGDLVQIKEGRSPKILFFKQKIYNV